MNFVIRVLLKFDWFRFTARSSEIRKNFEKKHFPKNVSKSVKSGTLWFQNVSKIFETLEFEASSNTSRKWIVTFLETWSHILDWLDTYSVTWWCFVYVKTLSHNLWVIFHGRSCFDLTSVHKCFKNRRSFRSKKIGSFF